MYSCCARKWQNIAQHINNIRKHQNNTNKKLLPYFSEFFFFFADIDWVKVKEKNIKTSLWCRKTIRFHSGAQNVRKKLKKFVYLWFHDYLKKYCNFTKASYFLCSFQTIGMLASTNAPLRHVLARWIENKKVIIVVANTTPLLTFPINIALFFSLETTDSI